MINRRKFLAGAVASTVGGVSVARTAGRTVTINIKGDLVGDGAEVLSAVKAAVQDGFLSRTEVRRREGLLDDLQAYEDAEAAGRIERFRT